jgi:Tol biopolymer transport system component
MRDAHCWLLAGSLLTAYVPAVAETTVTLTEGTDLHVSASASGEGLSFDLAGLIWTVNPADGSAEPLTGPELLARRPALSPDGQRIVFESGAPGRRQLQLISAGGGVPTLLTYGEFDHQDPAWHPDGQRIAFASNRGSTFDIWELDLDTLNLTQRSFAAGDERDPAYNARGDQLAYVAATGDGDGLFVLTADGKARLVVSSPGSLHAPSWRPDDTLLTYVHRTPGNSELRMVILSDPPVVKPLTRGENVFASPALWLDREHFIYAADGRLRQRAFDDFKGTDLAFQARLRLPDGAADLEPRNPPGSAPEPVRGITGYGESGERRFVSALGNLWEIDGSGAAVAQLTASPFLDTQLSASPDGRRLAFVSDRGGSLQIWLLELDTGTSREVTGENGSALYPAWRPDGGAIAYLVESHPDARNLTLKTVTVATGETRELARGLPDASPPDWLPGSDSVVLTAGGQALAFQPDGLPTPAVQNLPAGGQAFRFAPDGAYLAWLDGDQLFVAEQTPDGAATVVVTADDATDPRWVDGGRRLTWLGPAGLMSWTRKTGAITPVPLGLTWQARQPPSSRRLVIRAGKVFDGLGPGYEYAQDIVIAGDRIESIGPWRDPPPGELLDARELTVLPGLMDLAVRPRRPQGEMEGRAWLAFGVTTVREFADDLATTLERRESWSSGQRPGPRLFPAVLGCGDSDRVPGADVAVAVAICDDQSGASQASWIRQAQLAGLASIATAAFPGALLGARETPLRGRADPTPGYPDAANRLVYGDVIEIAGAAGLTSVSLLSAIGLPALVGSGDDGLATDSRIDSLYRPAAIDWYHQTWERQAEIFGTALRSEARTAGQSLFRAVGRGARIVTGSHAPTVPVGLGLHAELRLLRDTGLQPFQVLRMATRDAARAVGLQRQLGTLEPGRLADLIAVRGDPLQDISAAAAVEFTVVNGRVYRQSALLTRPGVGKFYSP